MLSICLIIAYVIYVHIIYVYCLKGSIRLIQPFCPFEVNILFLCVRDLVKMKIGTHNEYNIFGSDFDLKEDIKCWRKKKVFICKILFGNIKRNMI